MNNGTKTSLGDDYANGQCWRPKALLGTWNTAIIVLDRTTTNCYPTRHPSTDTIMARKAPAKEQIVKLIVGAGQASPSPPVGPALGSKGVKSMDFCKVCH